MRSNGGFGANAGLMMPLFSAPTGMLDTMIEGGWEGGFNHGGQPGRIVRGGIPLVASGG